MSWVENLLIVAGASLDIFAAMECHGSLVKQVNKKQLTLVCGLVTLWQLIALFIGYFVSHWYCKTYPSRDEAFLGEIVAVAIFACLGIRLIRKAIRNELVNEHLVTEFHLRKFIKIASVTGIYTIFAGIAFGFLETNLLVILIMIVLFTIACIVAGMYTGYHFGFEQKTKAYIIGAILLWLAGADVVVRYVLHLF